MLIGVMTDLHLGHRQYGSIDREKDFYIQLRKCVDELNKHDCDIVIIAGDIFDKANPSPEAMHQYIDKIGNLNADVVLATKGNHTMLLRDNHYSVDEFFADDGIEGYYLLDNEAWTSHSHAMASNYDMEYKKFSEADNIWVDGITYHGNSQINDFIDVQHLLAGDKAVGDTFRILVIHQAVSEFCGFSGEDLSIKDFDLKPYDIVICGHIHSRLYQELSDGTIFLQPGSIERLNTTEARDEIENQKGVWTIDTETKEVLFHYVPQERVFLMDSIDIRDDKDIEEHKKMVLNLHEYLDVAPIVAYDYHDYIGNRQKITDMITEISKEALLSNCNIYDETEEDDFDYDVPEDGIVTIDELIRQREDLSESEKQLVIDIHKAFKKDDETIELLLSNYFDKHFDDSKVDILNDFNIVEEEKFIKECEDYFNNL